MSITTLIEAPCCTAKRRYDAGERLNFSTGIDNTLTYGYGALDDFGYWEFQVRYSDLRAEHRVLVDKINEAL